MNDPLMCLELTIRQQVSHELENLKGRVRTLVEKYDTREKERDEATQPYRDEAGDVTDYYRYDELRADQAYAAEEDLGILLGELADLLARHV
ncbi:hypothetical protein ACFU6R_03075 [Streptomyces sp. NPDC057499]|uniref:hypothetical protein n=1 Tax=Streptomyces sp. NPDC057499 TaxID=3346150 RepID=UPI00368C163C